MSLYKLVTYKHCNTFNEKFENVYTLQVVGAADQCENSGDDIVAAERDISYDTIDFDGFAVFAQAGGPALFKKMGYVGGGNLDSTGLGGILPLFNTVRVTFTNALGRPEIKYIRGGYNAANIGSGAWDGDLITAIQDDYADVLLGNLEYVGPSGEAHTGVIVQTAVQMRQLGWNRRVRPGYHRGWVPD